MYFIKVRFDRNLGDLRNKVQRLMDEMVHLSRPVLSLYDTGWSPEADMYETQDEIFVVVDLAGVRKEDIEVSIHENYLRIKGQRAQNVPRAKPVRYHQLEMGHGDFERIFRIPTLIIEDQIEASYSDGLLSIKMRKAKATRGIYLAVKT